MASIRLYGIPNCDTVKKARNWLDANSVHYVFHDFRKDGIGREIIDAWLAAVSWEMLINRKGTTWRGLPDERKAEIVDAASATELMLEMPAVIRRPVLLTGDDVHIGFSAPVYQHIFLK